MSVTASSAFLAALKDSRLLSRDEFAAASREVEHLDDPKDMARRLLDAGTLTPWQADVLLSGGAVLRLGKYRLLDLIGSGEMGQVYLAEHTQMARRVALKTLSRRHTNDPQSVETFLADARVIAAFDHRNLIHVYDVGQEGKRYFLVMEYVEGRSLADAVVREPLSAVTAVDYVCQAACGLARAHDSGVVHGDVNPTHLLLDASGTIKVSGLGVARLTRPAGAASGESSSSAPSSSEFAAPEVRSGGSADARSDVYALGATLHFLLTGSAAHGDASAVPAALRAVCQQMMAPEPDARFETAREAAEALEAWLSDSRRLGPAGDGNGAARVAAGKPPQAGPSDSSAAQRRQRRKLAVAKSLAASTAAPLGSGAPCDNAADAVSVRDAVSIHIDTKGGAHTGSSAKGRPSDAQPRVGRKRTVWPLIAAAIGAAALLLAGLGVGGVYIVWSQIRNSRPISDSGGESVALKGAGAGGENGAAEIDSSDDGGASDTTSGEGVGGSGGDSGGTTEPIGDPPVGDSTPRNGTGAGEPPRPPDINPPANGGKTTPDPVPDPPPGPTDPPPPDPPAGTNTPEPVPAVNPFEGLPTAVDLPPLRNARAPGAEALSQELVPLRLAPSAIVAVQIEGGDKAARGAFSFSIRREDAAPRSWQVMMNSGVGASASATPIARLAVTDDALGFKWLEAAEGETAANYLRNCMLRLDTGEWTHAIALRTAVTFDEIAVSLNRPLSKTDATIEWLPDPSTLQVEIVDLRGELPPYRFEPKQTLESARDSTWVYFGPPEKESVLGLKIDSRVSRTLRVDAVPYFKVASEAKEIRFTTEAALQASGKATAALARLQALKTDLDQLPEPQKTASQPQRMLVEQQIATLQTALVQLADLDSHYKVIGDSCRVRLRVYHVVGETKVELAHSADAAPPPP